MGFCFVWLLHGIMFVIRNQKRSQNFADVPQLLGITSVCNSTVECYDSRLSTSTTIEKKLKKLSWLDSTWIHGQNAHTLDR